MLIPLLYIWEFLSNSAIETQKFLALWSLWAGPNGASPIGASPIDISLNGGGPSIYHEVIKPTIKFVEKKITVLGSVLINTWCSLYLKYKNLSCDFHSIKQWAVCHTNS